MENPLLLKKEENDDLESQSMARTDLAMVMREAMKKDQLTVQDRVIQVIQSYRGYGMMIEYHDHEEEEEIRKVLEEINQCNEKFKIYYLETSDNYYKVHIYPIDEYECRKREDLCRYILLFLTIIFSTVILTPLLIC